MDFKNLFGPASEAILKRLDQVINDQYEKSPEFKNKFNSKFSSPWEINNDCVSLQLKPYDRIWMFGLVNSDNELVNKVVIILTHLCLEMSELVEEAERDLFIPILLYGQPINKDVPEKDSVVKFANFLPILHKINCFWTHSVRILTNVWQQLNALHRIKKDTSHSKSPHVYTKSAHFQVVFEHIGRLLSVFISFDHIFEKSMLKEDCKMYLSLLKSIQADQSVLDVSIPEKDISNLQKFVTVIDERVIKGFMFKNLLNEISSKCGSSITKNIRLREEFSTVLVGWSAQIDESGSENWLWESKFHAVGVCALCLFYSRVFDESDKKIAKILVGLFKKVPCVFVGINRVFIIEDYLRKNFASLSSQLDKKIIDALLLQRKQHLAARVQCTVTDCQKQTLKVSCWSIRIGTSMQKSPSKLTKQDLTERANIIWEGFTLASSLRETAETILGMHTALDQPMNKSCVIYICRILELLKAIKSTYHAHTSHLAQTLPLLRQYFGLKILRILKNTEDELNRHKIIPSLLDIMAGLSVAKRAMFSNGNRESLLIARVALSIAAQDRAISEGELLNLVFYLRRLSILSDVMEKIEAITEATFVIEHRIFFEIYLRDFISNINHADPSRLQYLCAAMNDLDGAIRRPALFPSRQLHIGSLREGLEGTVKKELLEKICELVETELRLRSHLHLNQDEKLPFDKISDFKNLSPIVHSEPFKLFGNIICVKDCVVQYLQKAFYNLSVIAPHNAHTYQTMRNILSSSYGLDTVDPDLPSCSLEQGVDVLDILRNLHSFVERFRYNMYEQFFIELRSENKYLSTVSIKHVAASIRIHGSGIINTAVNYTYQFLKKKLRTLSEFLFDEHIKSRLLKDDNFWRNTKESKSPFPYARALKFHKGIRTLGVSSSGLTYLDQFRELVTQIGNAIGYVRLLRSGYVQCLGEATRFIPDRDKMSKIAADRDLSVDKNVVLSAQKNDGLSNGKGDGSDPFATFTELCQIEKGFRETEKVAATLDRLIDNLVSNWHQGTDYFKILVEVFAPVAKDRKNNHLSNFYLSVPALTVNFVEYFCRARENLAKKAYCEGNVFTDDGFALGVVYLLNVFGQNELFHTLHWWNGLHEHFSKEKEKVELEVQNLTASDQNLKQTLDITLARLEEQRSCYELISQSVHSAQSLFNFV